MEISIFSKMIWIVNQIMNRSQIFIDLVDGKQRMCYIKSKYPEPLEWKRTTANDLNIT